MSMRLPTGKADVVGGEDSWTGAQVSVRNGVLRIAPSKADGRSVVEIAGVQRVITKPRRTFQIVTASMGEFTVVRTGCGCGGR